MRTNLGTFHANNPSQFQSAQEAVRFCTVYCKAGRIGCAVDCALRKYWRIPPHGPKWPDSHEMTFEEAENKC